MSFLNQLKSQASALQEQKSALHQNLDVNIAQTEAACKTAWHYISDLSRQLNVIAPPGPKFSLDGKTPWPAMKLIDFRADFRKKKLRDREVFDYIGMGWQIFPQMGAAVGGTVTVNFPPDLERVQSRLSIGMVKHERKEVRHPEKNTLQAFRFEYITETRGSVTITPDHDNAKIDFRIVNASGFEVINTSWPAVRIQTDVLDELAKMIVAQPSSFV